METTKKVKLPKSEILHIPLNQILPDDNQPRQSFNEAENIELAKSVARDGILQPILVRPISSTGPSRYKVVFGHRRLWAAKYNRMDAIPAQVKDLSDDQVLEIQIIENLQRKNINPMEESDAFQRLISKSITTAEQIADKLGVSTKYVYDRMALQKVIDPVKEQIRKGTISISHGKQFARLQANDQEALFENIFLADDDDEGNPQIHEDISVAKVRSEIHDSFSRVLSDAIFSTADAKLVAKAGSCEKCPKRSGCNLLLFDDIQQRDICFDSECYKKKEKTHLENLITKLEKEGKKVVRISARYRTLMEGVLHASDWGKVEEGDGEPDAYGVVVEGPNYSYGEVVKLGDVIPVKLEIEEDKYDNYDSDNDEEDDNEGTSPMERGISQLIGKNSNCSGPRIDHEEEISKKIVSALVEKYKEDPEFLPDTRSYYAKAIKHNFGSLENFISDSLFDLNEWEKVLDEDGDFDLLESVKKLVEVSETYELQRILHLTDLCEHAEFGWGQIDAESLHNTHEKLMPHGIDVNAIVDNYCKENDYEIS